MTVVMVASGMIVTLRVTVAGTPGRKTRGCRRQHHHVDPFNRFHRFLLKDFFNSERTAG
jgi:hypothetical protein